MPPQDWTISRNSYYADFFAAPLAVISMMFFVIDRSALVTTLFLIGILVWTALEYFVHRHLFHRLYRREHWMHHMTPATYIGVPWWQTQGMFLTALICLIGLIGVSAGGALWSGVVLGYWVYIVIHDRFHHGCPELFQGYMRRQFERHDLHHGGEEINFGVSSPLWDYALRTYRKPA